MPMFTDIFEAYGMDYFRTMERFMGNEKLYLKLLDMLFQDDNLKKLGDALNSGNMAGAFEAAHTLKGVSANMGLTALYNAVCALVEPLRRSEKSAEYPVLYQAVLTEFDRVDAMRKQLKGEAQP